MEFTKENFANLLDKYFKNIYGENFSPSKIAKEIRFGFSKQKISGYLGLYGKAITLPSAENMYVLANFFQLKCSIYDSSDFLFLKEKKISHKEEEMKTLAIKEQRRKILSLIIADGKSFIKEVEVNTEDIEIKMAFSKIKEYIKRDNVSNKFETLLKHIFND